MEKRRIDCFDIVKGIGILLVVFGHLSTDEQLSRNIVYAFHMPLFFFVSGIFAKEKCSVAESLKKSVRTLYVPFISIVAVDAAILFAKSILRSSLDIKELASSFALTAVGLKDPMLNTPVWFLLSLMLIRLMFCLIAQINNKKAFYTILGCFTAICALTVIFSERLNLPAQWVCVKSFAGFCFYAAGFFMKKYITKTIDVFENKKKSLNIICVFATAALAVLAEINGSVSIYKGIYSNPFLFFINAFLGIFVLFIVSENVDKCKPVFAGRLKSLLIFYGRNSVIILITHYYLARIIIPAAFKLAKIGAYLYNPFAESFLLVAVSLAMIPVIIIFNRFLYFIIGKKKPTDKNHD